MFTIDKGSQQFRLDQFAEGKRACKSSDMLGRGCESLS